MTLNVSNSLQECATMEQNEEAETPDSKYRSTWLMSCLCRVVTHTHPNRLLLQIILNRNIFCQHNGLQTSSFTLLDGKRVANLTYEYDY